MRKLGQHPAFRNLRMFPESLIIIEKGEVGADGPMKDASLLIWSREERTKF